MIRLQFSEVCELSRIFLLSDKPLTDLQHFDERVFEERYGDESLSEYIVNDLFERALQLQQKIDSSSSSPPSDEWTVIFPRNIDGDKNEARNDDNPKDKNNGDAEHDNAGDTLSENTDKNSVVVVEYMQE